MIDDILMNGALFETDISVASKSLTDFRFSNQLI